MFLLTGAVICFGIYTVSKQQTLAKYTVKIIYFDGSEEEMTFLSRSNQAVYLDNGCLKTAYTSGVACNVKKFTFISEEEINRD